MVTGEIPQQKRSSLYTSKIIVSTPQTIKNDIGKRVYPFQNTWLAVFDEAHRAVGDYAYVKIAESLPPNCLRLALTASPGGDRARVKEVVRNLGIQNIEVFGDSDPAVLPYMKTLSKQWLPVDLSPELKKADGDLLSLINHHSRKLADSYQKPPITSKKQFMLYGKRLQTMRHPARFAFLSHYYALMHLLHLQELVQTQGPHPSLNYINKLRASPSRTAAGLLSQPEMASAIKELSKAGDHPKTKKLLNLLSSAPGKKTIVFVQYRDQIKRLKEVLDQNNHTSRIFVGKRDGFTRKMQEETIDAFRRGEFNVLIASSIGEEGLDIPAVDSVIFYEPIPSEIRSIQRRGRAGRFKDGSVYVLMARGTRDEYYYWASRRREEKMRDILLSLKKELFPKNTKEIQQNHPNPKNQNNKNTGQSLLTRFQ